MNVLPRKLTVPPTLILPDIEKLPPLLTAIIPVEVRVTPVVVVATEPPVFDIDVAEEDAEAVLTLVMRPKLSTVNTGMAVADP
jgi:hypothetical protein